VNTRAAETDDSVKDEFANRCCCDKAKSIESVSKCCDETAKDEFESECCDATAKDEFESKGCDETTKDEFESKCCINTNIVAPKFFLAALPAAFLLFGVLLGCCCCLLPVPSGFSELLFCADAHLSLCRITLLGLAELRWQEVTCKVADRRQSKKQ